jgi:peptidoglycan/LPS O-acetylase OafA/YrhL
MNIPFNFLPEKNQEILSVQYLRGIAAQMVMVYHYMPWLFFSFISIEGKELLKTGRHGVFIFFCISGFVLTLSLIRSNYSYSNFLTFFKKRLVRIEPPYLLSVFLVLCFWLFRKALGLDVAADISLRNVLFHIGYLNSFTGGWLTVVYWTLAIEFMFYLLIALIFPILNLNKGIFRVCVYGVLLYSGIVFQMNEFIPKYFPFFILGINTAFFLTQKNTVSEYFLVSTVCCILILQQFDLYVLLYCLITNFLFLVKLPRNKFLYFLGQISFSVYLLHTITGARVLMLGFRFETGSLERSVFFLGAIAVSIITAWIYYKKIEKPCISWSKKIN